MISILASKIPCSCGAVGAALGAVLERVVVERLLGRLYVDLKLAVFGLELLILGNQLVDVL